MKLCDSRFLYINDRLKLSAGRKELFIRYLHNDPRLSSIDPLINTSICELRKTESTMYKGERVSQVMRDNVKLCNDISSFLVDNALTSTFGKIYEYTKDIVPKPFVGAATIGVKPVVVPFEPILPPSTQFNPIVKSSSLQPSSYHSPSDNAISADLYYPYDRRRISYQAVCTVVNHIINIGNVKGNELTQDMDNKRREQLTQDIMILLKSRQLAASFSRRDFASMEIAELVTYHKELDLAFETQKVVQVVRHGMNVASSLYTQICPTGIKIGSAHLRFNGVGDKINDELITVGSNMNVCLEKFIRKRSIKVSDEMALGSSVVSILINSIEYTRDAPVTPATPGKKDGKKSDAPLKDDLDDLIEPTRKEPR